MSENWTKGPWRYEPERDNFENYPMNPAEAGSFGGSIMGHGSHIARIWNDAGDDEDEFVANAHLIAAAPEMYEALTSYPGVYSGPEEFASWIVKVDAAIRKARGEA